MGKHFPLRCVVCNKGFLYWKDYEPHEKQCKIDNRYFDRDL